MTTTRTAWLSSFIFHLSAFPCWPDFTTPTRQLTLRQPTDEAETIIDAALRLFEQIWSRGQPVRGKAESKKMKAEKSSEDTESSEAFIFQLSALSFPSQARQARLRATVDALHARFGTGFARREGEVREEQG